MTDGAGPVLFGGTVWSSVAGGTARAVAGFLARTPAAWITGAGWSMESFPEGTPAAALPDGMSVDRAAFLVHRDGHRAWVKSRALDQAGIDASTPGPPHGRIERDGAGRPHGTLHEGAMDLVARLVSPASPEEPEAALLPFLGPARSGWQYPFASLAGTGARLAGGSDWVVSTVDPLEEIAVAVDWVLPESTQEGAPAEPPFLPEERMALESALQAFTAGSADVNHLDDRAGPIEPGELADLVVLRGDPFEVPTERLPEARVCCTIVGGEVAFESGEV